MSEIIPLGRWVDQSVHYLLDHDASTFDSIGKAIESFAALIEHGLQAIPMWALMAFFIGIGLWRGGGGLAPFFARFPLFIFFTSVFGPTGHTPGVPPSLALFLLLLWLFPCLL